MLERNLSDLAGCFAEQRSNIVDQDFNILSKRSGQAELFLWPARRSPPSIGVIQRKDGKRSLWDWAIPEDTKWYKTGIWSKQDFELAACTILGESTIK